MKKFLLSIAMFAGGLLAVNAQTLSFLDFSGNTIPNGGTYTFKGWESNPEGIQIGQTVDYAMVTINPKLSIKSTEDDLITVTATCKTHALFQLCTPGADHGQNNVCEYSSYENPTLTKKDIDTLEGDIIPLELETIMQFFEGSPYGTTVNLPYIEIDITVYSETDPDNKATMTLRMGDLDSDAGVESIGTGTDYVKVSGNTLSYEVAGEAALNVYSLTGKAVLSSKVSGKGNVDLTHLAKGVYAYKVSGKKGLTGKFVKK